MVLDRRQLPCIPANGNQYQDGIDITPILDLSEPVRCGDLRILSRRTLLLNKNSQPTVFFVNLLVYVSIKPGSININPRLQL